MLFLLTHLLTHPRSRSPHPRPLAVFPPGPMPCTSPHTTPPAPLDHPRARAGRRSITGCRGACLGAAAVFSRLRAWSVVFGGGWGKGGWVGLGWVGIVGWKLGGGRLICQRTGRPFCGLGVDGAGVYVDLMGFGDRQRRRAGLVGAEGCVWARFDWVPPALATRRNRHGLSHRIEFGPTPTQHTRTATTHTPPCSCSSVSVAPWPRGGVAAPRPSRCVRAWAFKKA